MALKSKSKITPEYCCKRIIQTFPVISIEELLTLCETSESLLDVGLSLALESLSTLKAVFSKPLNITCCGKIEKYVD